ncbi:AcrR family transcriptional regulator [Psychromicrobium silvestre]|uniref:AcrR family transcriptional regulator n=1 Tax=Psychromicrobium silvestre TaxID=1645614 RepID=A0A7Y9S4S9_9MICC|nr:TetR/AcrR family transcriptional regulator [Psychromicrobium silvestre]NYE94564.1 AcrR family transcriptional regulator [Psychromicrobium silvestre]
MIDAAGRLLAERGLQETSFSHVVELSGAPRGSIYHHFPEGKNQLVAEALAGAGARAMQLMEQARGESAGVITQRFVEIWSAVLVRSKLSAGCSVLAVAVAADSAELLNRAAEVFRAWRGFLAEMLRQSGVPELEATRFATQLIASIEGAVVLSRAERTMEPFELVVAELLYRAQELSEAAVQEAS